MNHYFYNILLLWFVLFFIPCCKIEKTYEEVSLKNNYECQNPEINEKTKISKIDSLSSDSSPLEIKISSISSKFEHVKFSHRKHAEFAEKCSFCHHNQEEEEEVLSCSECHEKSGRNLESPSLSGAYHRLCINCHKQNGVEISCTFCHKKKE